MRQVTTMVELEQVQARPPRRAEAVAPLSCEVFRDFAGLDRLRTAWDEVVLRAGGSIYMTYDWVRLWWDVYGESAELRLFVFSAGERVVAILPIYVDTLGWGPLRLRVARLVGANIPPKVFSPPVPASCATEVFAQVLAHLFGPDACDVLSFGPVSELDHANTGLVTACERRADLMAPHAAANGVHSVYYLPANMEEYFGSLRQSERKNRRKLELRTLKKECDTRVEVVSDPTLLSEAFEHFVEQHRQQWRAEGRTGHFGAWPHALDFHRALIRAQGERGRLRFIRIVADGQVIASEYAFAFGDRYHAELTSRAVDPKWDRFSLGPTSTVTMLAQGIAEGVQRVESGLGHYDYKVRLGTKEHTALTFRIVASGLPSRARFALFTFLKRCVSLAYHKTWYRRVAPRLPPSLWRPQWRQWLRLDF
jgi:CelD/BcsL family acetyltransferase involved in cellulose biosynthesis